MRALSLAILVSACASQRGAVDLPEGPVALRLEGLDGETLTLGSLRGRPVLVTIVTTWSDFALLEVPRFKALAARYGDELAIVCIALDEDRRMVEIFRDTFEIPYAVTLPSDPTTLTSERGPFGSITVIPTSILLDREGKVSVRQEGTWPPKLLEEAVQKVAGKIPAL